MQTIVFNSQPSDLNRKSEAIALKAGYLLGDETFCAGTTTGEFFIREMLDSLHISRKLGMMTNFYNNQPEYHNVFSDIQKNLKNVSKVKIRTKEMLASQKKLEAMVYKCWDTAMSHLEGITDKYGFGVFRPLVKEHTIGFMAVDVNPEMDDEPFIAVSNLFRRIVQESIDNKTPIEEAREDYQDLFFLGSEFLSGTYHHTTLFSPGSFEAIQSDNMYLSHCFTLPYIQMLTTAELQSVRSQLRNAGAAFRRQTDQWCKMCYDKEENASRVDHFTSQVLPSALALQEAIDNDAILSLCRRIYGHLPDINVWMGEIPVWELWNYFRQMKAFNNDTWQKLQEVKNDPEFAQQRWPVMMLKIEDDIAADENPDEIIVSIRKFLSVD